MNPELAIIEWEDHTSLGSEWIPLKDAIEFGKEKNIMISVGLIIDEGDNYYTVIHTLHDTSQMKMSSTNVNESGVVFPMKIIKSTILNIYKLPLDKAVDLIKNSLNH